MVQCEKSGCVGEKCFQHCKFSSDGKPIDGPWYMQEPLYLRWKQWDCRSDCRYHCMLAREEEREKLGDKPVKYHGKWPFQRVYGIQVFLSYLLQHIGYSSDLAIFTCVYDGLIILNELAHVFMFIGTCCCCSFCSQSCHAISWLDIFFHPCILQIAFESK